VNFLAEKDFQEEAEGTPALQERLPQPLERGRTLFKGRGVSDLGRRVKQYFQPLKIESIGHTENKKGCNSHQDLLVINHGLRAHGLKSTKVSLVWRNINQN